MLLRAVLALGLQLSPLVSYAAPADPPFPVPRPRGLDSRPANPTVPVDPAPPPTPRPVPGLPIAPVAPPPMTADCLAALKAQNVVVETTPIPPQTDPRCIVAEPVRLSGLRLPGGLDVAFPDRPTIACTAAATFSTFVRDLLVPLAKGSYGSPVNAVWTGPGLECRTRDHVVGAKLSAHAQGLAVDVAEFKLADGRMIEVGRPRTDLDRSFETAARAGGCGYFHTSLGPGSDSFHETHWHFDLLPRGSAGDAKFCQ